MIKYGTFKIYKCTHCDNIVEVPLHLKDSPQLEKYASFCTHEWEEVGEKQNAKINEEESRSLQSSEARA